jgi:hypothetical protein
MIVALMPLRSGPGSDTLSAALVGAAVASRTCERTQIDDSDGRHHTDVEHGIAQDKHLRHSSISRTPQIALKTVSFPHRVHSKVRFSSFRSSGTMRVGIMFQPHLGQGCLSIGSSVWTVE